MKASILLTPCSVWLSLALPTAQIREAIVHFQRHKWNSSSRNSGIVMAVIGIGKDPALRLLDYNRTEGVSSINCKFAAGMFLIAFVKDDFKSMGLNQ
jgi:hypothetical protein